LCERLFTDGRNIGELIEESGLTPQQGLAILHGKVRLAAGLPTYLYIGRKIAENRQYGDSFDIVPGQETVNCRARTLPNGIG
jgi:hypothetical protein